MEMVKADRVGKFGFIRNHWPYLARRTLKKDREQATRKGRRGQATGGGRFWMVTKAGSSMVGAVRLQCAVESRKAHGRPAKAGGGSVATAENAELGLDTTWSRRRQQSASAGFWIACKSSVTEMTGNKIKMSRANATNCVRCPVAVHGVNRSQMQSITAASQTHARFRTASITTPILHEN